MVSDIAYKAFNLKGAGIQLEGGQNNSYRYGNIIIKKNDGDNVNIDLICTILSRIDSDRYRVAKPVLSINNRFIEDGYVATFYEEGQHHYNNIEEVIYISNLFHNDIQHYSIDLMKDVDTKWTNAMDILFRNRDIPYNVDNDNLETCLNMMKMLKPFNDELQIIHGDIGGNILFHSKLPPCIIDFSPCIAPAKMANAIVITDYVTWVNSDLSKLHLLKPFEEYKNYIAYAVMFRLLSALCSKEDSKYEFETEYSGYIKVWNYVSKICN